MNETNTSPHSPGSRAGAIAYSVTTIPGGGAPSPVGSHPSQTSSNRPGKIRVPKREVVVDHRHVRPPSATACGAAMVDALAEHDGATLSGQPALQRAHVEPAKPRRLEDCIPIHCVTRYLGVGIRHERDHVGAERVGHAADRLRIPPRGPGMRCRGCARTVAASPLRPRRSAARRRRSARLRRWGTPAASGCPGSARRPSAASGKRPGVWSCRGRRGAPGSAARTSRCNRRAPCGGSRRRTPRAARRRGRTHSSPRNRNSDTRPYKGRDRAVGSTGYPRQTTYPVRLRGRAAIVVRSARSVHVSG